MSRQNLNFAILGCGRIGQRHAKHIVKNSQLVAVCDTDKEKANSLANEYKTTAYYDIEDLLSNEESIDVVAVCTPNGLHANHTIKSLKAGKHVLCEKPMSINVHDCGKMIHAAEQANKRLFIVKQNRFNPPVVAIKNLIDEGKLGKIYTVQLNCFWNRNPAYYNTSDWKGTKALDGGTLYTQFSHFVDLLYYMIGDVKEVHAYGANFNHHEEIEFEDNGVVILKFYNGALGTVNFTINSYGKNMEGSITIFAEKGTVKIGGQYLNELEYQNIEGIKIGDLPEGNPPNNYGQYVGSMSNHDKVYENVIEVLTKDGIIATNGYEGLKTVEIIDKIYESIAKAK
jgi:UDP-N-acetyl-2-amino-2-deoxyglucuronate dehydrogenase